LDDEIHCFVVRFGPAPVALASSVLNEQDTTSSEMANFTVAGLDARFAAEVDEELSPWRWMPVALPAGRRRQETDARGRDEVRYVERRRGRGKINGVKGDLKRLLRRIAPSLSGGDGGRVARRWRWFRRRVIGERFGIDRLVRRETQLRHARGLGQFRFGLLATRGCLRVHARGISNP
jgi:hypothetical protein